MRYEFAFLINLGINKLTQNLQLKGIKINEQSLFFYLAYKYPNVY